MQKWHIVSNILIVQEHLDQNEFSGTVLMDKSLNELIAILAVLTAQLLERRASFESHDGASNADKALGAQLEVFPYCFKGEHSEGALDD